MGFAHERMDVYQVALDFLVIAEGVIGAVPRGRGHIVDQLTRASTSIVLNIAEGAGKFSRPDKRRYYLSAIGSATECAAILDVCERMKMIEAETLRRGKETLDRIAAMLVKLAKAMETEPRATGAGSGAGAGGGGD